MTDVLARICGGASSRYRRLRTVPHQPALSLRSVWTIYRDIHTAHSVVVFGSREVVDQLDELRFTAGLRDVGAVLAVHHEKWHALHVVALGDLLRALQIGADREGVVGL